MEDSLIIDLYFKRSEEAIKETDIKYHQYCENIGYHILKNHQDTEECINDCYFKTWNAIPPTRPNSLQSFLGKIMRNLSLDCYRKKHSQKRGGNEFGILLSELNECIPSNDSVWDSYNSKMLSEAIDKFLNEIPEKQCIVFIKRYYFCKSIKEIGKECSMTTTHVKVLLFRIRSALKRYLEMENFEI